MHSFIIIAQCILFVNILYKIIGLEFKKLLGLYRNLVGKGEVAAALVMRGKMVYDLS
jgi:hypothetical protein